MLTPFAARILAPVDGAQMADLEFHDSRRRRHH
jgi:hypothetical protein